MEKQNNSLFESSKINSLVNPLKPIASGTSMLFPELNWNLKKQDSK